MIAWDEALYRRLVEDQTELVSLATPDGELTFVNRAYARWHGMQPREMVGRNLLDFVPEAGRADVSRHLRAACEARHSIETENQVMLPDGQMRWIAWTNRALVDPRGRVTAIHSVGRDIEWRILAERRVKDSEARFRLLAENSNDLILLIRLDGKRVYASPACRRMLGFEPEEMLSMFPRDSIHPDDLPMVMDLLAQSRVEGDTHTYRMRRKDGGYVWVETRAQAVTGNADQAPLRLLVVRDIEERMATERRLRDSEARYRLLAENSTDMVFQLDLDFKRRYVSPACREIIGYEPEELIGVRPAAMAHPDDAERVAGIFRSLLDGGAERRSVVNRIRHRDGHWVWVEAELRTLKDPDTGAPAGIIGAMRDISERKRQADALEHARDEAEAAGRVKAEFLANMSHELRTPLTGILGIHELLQADQFLSEKQRRLVGLAQVSGRALLLVVNDVLDYSKLDAGKLELSPVRFSIAELISDSVAIIAGSASEKQLELRISTDETIPDLLFGDDGRLRQVLLNLLNNAVKFTRFGHVALSVERMGSCAQGEHLRFSVSDTGVGIPEDKIGRLFRRFSQVDGSTSREFGGTGLGLAICKRLVEVMGGEIGVESRPGEGSIFWFTVTLPIAPASADAPLEHDAVPPRRSARILVAEDVDINKEIVGAMLGAAGHEVDMVSDGAEAVLAVEAKGYDLILMDIQMPGVDGVAATKLIRALPGPASHVPIIAMTANVLPTEIAHFRASGMDDHVAKPFKRIELLNVVARNLRPDEPNRASTTPRLPSLSSTIESPRLDERSPAINEEKLGSLTSLLGSEKVAILLGKLSQRLEGGFVQDAFTADGRAGLAREAHMLISTAGSLGLDEVSRRCVDLEAAIRAEADVASLLDQVRQACATAIVEIAERSEAGAAARKAARPSEGDRNVAPAWTR